MSKDDTPSSDGWIKNLKAVTELPVSVLGSLAVVLGTVLFAPDPYAKGLGFEAFLDQFRPFVGVAFLLVSVLLLSRLGTFAYDAAVTKRAKKQELERLQERLHTLTAQEKEILRPYIEEKKRVHTFAINNGVVNVLMMHTVLGRAANMGDPGFWPFHIQPWAWDYLTEHPELLEPDEAEIAARDAEAKEEARRRWRMP